MVAGLVCLFVCLSATLKTIFSGTFDAEFRLVVLLLLKTEKLCFFPLTSQAEVYCKKMIEWHSSEAVLQLGSIKREHAIWWQYFSRMQDRLLRIRNNFIVHGESGAG